MARHPVAHELKGRLLSRSGLGLERTLWRSEKCRTTYQPQVQGYKAGFGPESLSFSQRRYGNRVCSEGHSGDSTPEEDSESVRQSDSEPEFASQLCNHLAP